MMPGKFGWILMCYRFALAGALGCAITHGALTPVDVVKTRIQLEPEVYNRVSRLRVVMMRE
jgi:solute carrier family 25 phosphate transporter 3